MYAENEVGISKSAAELDTPIKVSGEEVTDKPIEEIKRNTGDDDLVEAFEQGVLKEKLKQNEVNEKTEETDKPLETNAVEVDEEHYNEAPKANEEHTPDDVKMGTIIFKY